MNDISFVPIGIQILIVIIIIILIMDIMAIIIVQLMNTEILYKQNLVR